MFIETSGKCAIHFDQEAKCVTDTGQLFHRFGQEGAQMFKKVYSLYSAFCIQPVFYSQSVFYPGPQSTVHSLLFTLTDFFITMPLTTKRCMLSFIIGYSANSLLQAFQICREEEGDTVDCLDQPPFQTNDRASYHSKKVQITKIKIFNSRQASL